MTEANNGEQPWQVLGPGKVYFNYGPVSMVVMADREGIGLTELCCQAFGVIDSSLKELTASLEILRQYPLKISARALTGLPLLMFEAVNAIGEETLTPMAAAAGAISDRVADWLFDQGATKVIVNNGGDIALRLAEEQSVKVGLISSLKLGQVDRVVTIKAEDGIGGIATSGLGGRGLTRGIAEGVSVFSHNAIVADALATHMANSSYIDSEKVITTTAGAINPLSDIKDLGVVVGVDILTRKEEKMALKKIELEARRQKEKGNLLSLCARIQNEVLEINMPNNEG